ncbi:MAG: hypothetical protein ACLFUO_01195 [Candidatus Woesearchaeota archaeon]
MQWNHIDDLVRNSPELEDGLKIKAICDDLGYRGFEKSTIQNEIHQTLLKAKAEFYDSLFNYLDKNKDVHRKAISVITNEEYLLALKSQIIINEINKDEHNKKKYQKKLERARSFILADHLKNLDRYLKENEGIEKFFETQLEQSLKLYDDLDFRGEELSFYFNEIVPRLPEYNLEMVKQSFEKSRHTSYGSDPEQSK